MNETQPLLPPSPTHLGDIDSQQNDLVNSIIMFDPDGDPENPMEWPKTYQRGVIFLLAFMAFTV